MGSSSSSTPSATSHRYPTVLLPSSSNSGSITPPSTSVSSVSQFNSTISGASSQTTTKISSGSSASNLTASATTNGNITATGKCTGCALEGIWPTTLSYHATSYSETSWIEVVQTSTLVLQTISYYDAIVTTNITVYQNKTVTEHATVPAIVNGTSAVHFTTPVFTWVPAEGTTITLDAGPTYVVYKTIYAGLDYGEPSAPNTRVTTLAPWQYPTCDNRIQSQDWKPTETANWYHYIQTYATAVPSHRAGDPVSLPADLIDYLKDRPDVSSWASGADIGTCTIRPTLIPGNSFVHSSPLPGYLASVEID